MAITFNGSSTFLNCGDVHDLTGSNSITVGCYVRRNATGVRHEIASKEGGASPTGWELSIQVSGVVQWGAFDGVGYPSLNSTTTIGTTTIHHVVGVYDDAAGQLRVYVDGVLENTLNDTAGAGNGENLNIGRRPDGTRYFNGEIEDLRIYDRALSDAEIASWANGRGKDRVFQGLGLRLGMREKPPGAVAIGLQNLQQGSAITAGSTITLSSYAIPANLPSPVLVVGAMGDDADLSDSQPSSCTFNGDTVTKRAGVNTSATAGSGSALFTRSVSSGQSGDIVVTFPASISGRTIFAYVIPESDGTIDTTNTNFNNGGATSTSFTTTGTNRVGITACSTGDTNAAFSTNGTGHVEDAEIVSGGTGFSGVMGSFPAASAQAYNGYGFNFAGGTNRSSQCMIALHSAPAEVPDQSENKFHGTMNGAVTYAESIAA